MRSRFLSLLLLALFSLTLRAQQQKDSIIAEGGGPDERASARILYWNRTKNAAAGQFAIDYGRPTWKKEYENKAKFEEMTRGKVWRLGKDFWTVLDTAIPLKIGGRDIPAGAWYLGLHRSDDGAVWSLAFIDPSKIRKTGLDAFEINRAPIEFRIPVTSSQAETAADKLTVTLSAKESDIKDVTLKILWGKLQVSAPVQAVPKN